jgi:hypothetical protein
MGSVVQSKRRNVFRVAGLHVLGPRLLTQLAATLLTLFEMPGRALRALLAEPLRSCIWAEENPGRPMPAIAPCNAVTPADSA